MEISSGMVYERVIISVVELKIFLLAPTPALAPRSRKSELRLQLQLRIVLKDTLKIIFFRLKD
jgi:hypothetical protein